MNVQPGGSLIVAWQAKDKPALVVGGGDVARGRVNALLDAGAVVTVVAPALTNPDLAAYIQSRPPNLTYVNKAVSTDGTNDSLSIDDLLATEKTAGYSLVLTAIDNPAVSRAIHAACKKIGIPVNVADVPPLCDFYFASAIRRGPLQVAVSTGGSAPRLARRIRIDVEESIDALGSIETAIEKVGVLRAKLRVLTDAEENKHLHETDQAKIKNRMKWMSAVCDGWSYAQLADLDEDSMDRLVAKYPDPPQPPLVT